MQSQGFGRFGTLLSHWRPGFCKHSLSAMIMHMRVIMHTRHPADASRQSCCVVNDCAWHVGGKGVVYCTDAKRTCGVQIPTGLTISGLNCRGRSSLASRWQRR